MCNVAYFTNRVFFLFIFYSIIIGILFIFFFSIFNATCTFQTLAKNIWDVLIVAVQVNVNVYAHLIYIQDYGFLTLFVTDKKKFNYCVVTTSNKWPKYVVKLPTTRTCLTNIHKYCSLWARWKLHHSKLLLIVDTMEVCAIICGVSIWFRNTDLIFALVKVNGTEISSRWVQKKTN